MLMNQTYRDKHINFYDYVAVQMRGALDGFDYVKLVYV